MKKSISLLLLSLIFIVSIIPIQASINNQRSYEKFISSVNNYLDGGWLDERNGIKILHLNGSYYEMGYQHGFLLKDDIHTNFNAFCNWAADN